MQPLGKEDYIDEDDANACTLGVSLTEKAGQELTAGTADELRLLSFEEALQALDVLTSPSSNQDAIMENIALNEPTGSLSLGIDPRAASGAAPSLLGASASESLEECLKRNCREITDIINVVDAKNSCSAEECSGIIVCLHQINEHWSAAHLEHDAALANDLVQVASKVVQLFRLVTMHNIT